MNPIITLGFLVVNYDHELNYLTNIAKRAQYYGIKCLMFKPKDINFDLLMVKGKSFNPLITAWENDFFPLPTLIYDRCFYGISAEEIKTKELVKKLKKYDHIHFLSHGLPDKWSLYCLLKNTNIKPFLPETYLVQKSDDVITYVKKFNSCILKPTTGAGGTGIIIVHYKKDRFVLKYNIHYKQKMRTFFQEKSVDQFLNQLVKKKRYLIQPLLPLCNEKNEPFDIRILIQKNFNGKWTIQGTGVRIGQKNTFVSNLAKGANVYSFNQWLNQMHLNIKEKILKEIEQMVFTLLPILDQHFSPLFEIGLDIGFDQKHEKLWILDINSKPGRKIVLQTNPNLETKLYDAPLLYAKYLMNLKLRKVGQHDLRNSNHPKASK